MVSQVKSTPLLLKLIFGGRVFQRVKVFSRYLYYYALEAISPKLSIERPGIVAAPDRGSAPADQSNSIELHLESDDNARAEFLPFDPAAAKLATRVADKFRTTTCANCDSRLTPVIQVVNADDPGDFIETAWCANCDHLQYSVMPSKAWINQWYGTRWDLAVPLETKLETRNATYRYVRRLSPYLPKRKLKVLDVGAGYGEKTRKFTEFGHSLYCTELTGARAEYLKKNVTENVFFGTLDDPKVQAELRKHAPFDVIFAYHVVEHVYNPRSELQFLREISSPDAIFYLAIPELYKEGIFQGIYSLAHISSFSRLSARMLMKQIGFKTLAARDDPFQYYSNYCQYLVGRKAGAGENQPVGTNKDTGKFARFLAEALRFDRLSKLKGSTFSFSYFGRKTLTYRISEESKAKCLNPADHLPVKFYHRGLPLFWND